MYGFESAISCEESGTLNHLLKVSDSNI